MPVPAFLSSLGQLSYNPYNCTAGAELWVTPGGGAVLSVWLPAGVCPASGVVPSDAIMYSVLANGTRLETTLTAAYFGGYPDAGSCWALKPYNCLGDGFYGGTVWQDARLVGGGSGGGGGTGGGTVSGELSIVPFQLTTAQQAEVYTVLAVVFGLFLAAHVAIWGGRRVLSILRTGARWGD